MRKLISNGQGIDLVFTGSELYADIETVYENYEPWLAVEINGEILPKSKYRETTIKSDDNVEIVSFVGGG